MSRPVSRDSLSRCEPSPMSYDAIRRPNERPNQTMKTSLDTQESTQERLNREMLERLRPDSKTLSHDTFVSVVQVGKYLFLAIMLPPYLLLYGIPKWFMMTAIPELALLVKSFFVQIGRYIQESSNKIADLMKGLMQQMIGNSLKLLSQKSKNFHIIFKEAISSILNGVALKVKLGFVAAKELIGNIVHPIADGLLHALYSLKEIVKKMFNGMKNVASPLIAECLNPLSQVVSSMRAFMGSLLNVRSLKIQTGLKTMAKAVNNAAKLAGKSLSMVRRHLQGILEGAVKRSLKGKEQISNLQKKLTKRLNKSIKPILHKVKNAFDQVYDPISIKVQAVTQMVAQVPQVILSAAYWLMPSTFISNYKRLGGLFGDGQRGKRFFATIKASFNGTVKASKAILYIALHRVGSFWQTIKGAIKRLFFSIKNFLIEFPHLAMRAILRLWTVAKKIGVHLLLALQISFACIRAFFYFSMQLVRETASQIILWKS